LLHDTPDDANIAAQAQLAEILAMALIDRGVIECEVICKELEELASTLRDEGQSAIATRLAGLAVSLRAVRKAV